MKALVTGGAGFIGSTLARELLKGGDEVVVIDNLSNGKAEKVPKGAVLIKADITDYESIAHHFEGVDTVYHFAALPRVQFSIEFPLESHNANVTGTLNVLRASLSARVRRVVYSSSSSVYGDQPILPLVETMETSPKSPYGLQKYIGEEYCRLWSNVFGLETVCLRYFNVYGPGQSADGAYALVIGKFMAQKKSGQAMTITGSGEQTRDFTNVKDVVNANILAGKSLKVGKGEPINIGAGNNVSINRIAELIGGKVEHIPARLEPKDTKADNRKAKELLGWVPTVSIEEGIAELSTYLG